MALEPPRLEEIRAARERLKGWILRTPLVRLDAESPAPIHLKLENLQPIGSFKLRGAANALQLADRAELARGAVTASAGNMAQGVAWAARRLGVPATAVVPDHAPEPKLAGLARLGCRVVKVPFEEWWRCLVERRAAGVPGHFVHPVSDPAVIAGNATIGLEILEDLPEVETVLVPFGGGGLSCGIAAAMRALKPTVRVVACEVETAAPLSAALAAGRPVPIEYRRSFVDGIGGRGVLEEMWPLASTLLAGAVTSTVERIAAAVRLLLERHRVLAEGAGATPVAAALGGAAAGVTVCVVSGGLLDSAVLARILAGEPV